MVQVPRQRDLIYPPRTSRIKWCHACCPISSQNVCDRTAPTRVLPANIDEIEAILALRFSYLSTRALASKEYEDRHLPWRQQAIHDFAIGIGRRVGEATARRTAIVRNRFSSSDCAQVLWRKENVPVAQPPTLSIMRFQDSGPINPSRFYLVR